MQVIICPDAQSAAREVADLVCRAIARNPRLVLGLAAGATPLGLYDELVRRHAAGLDFSAITAFGLDEYFGLDADHPQRFRNWIRQHLLAGVDVDPAQVHWLDSLPNGNIAAHCAAYERSIAAAGGIDLQILGIGGNGHLGFNEPGCSLAGPTHMVHLTAATRQANEKAFASPQEMPEAALTMGIGTILGARRIFLVAAGEAKARAVAAAVEGPVTAMVPASALQLHPDVVILLDAAAASALTRGSEYAAEVEMLRRYGVWDTY